MEGKKYPVYYKDMEDYDDAQKIEHTRRVRSTVMTRVIERPVPSSSTSSTSDSRKVLGDSTRQSRTRYISGTDSRRAQSSSPAPREINVLMSIDDESQLDENKPPYQSDLKRAQSEGDLLNGDLKQAKLKKIRSFPSLERRVRFRQADSDGYSATEDQRTREWRSSTMHHVVPEDKRRSRSYDELSWKKPSIEVRRKVQLLPQKEPSRRSRSADSSPRKGILKTKRITETSTIRISGTAPAGDMINQGTTSQGNTRSTDDQPTTSTTKDDEMDWTPYLTDSSTTDLYTTTPEKPKEEVFKLPTRYRVQKDIELEPDVKPKSMIFTRRWKSEPSLVTEKSQPRSRSVDRHPFEKETKLSKVKIDLIKPIDLKPLKPAYSIGDLPSQKTVRTETKFHMKPQRWKSNPELATREKLEEIHQRKPGREFEAKIVRALPVHLQPLHQPKPAKETPVKTTEVKDVSMQFASSYDTKSEGTQVRFDPSPLTVSTEQVYKSTQTVDQPERIKVPAPVIVEFQKSEATTKTPKMRPLQVKDIASYEYDMTSEKRESTKKQASDKIVVEYVKEPRKPKVEERMETKVYEDHATEVRFGKQREESMKTRPDIHVGRIDEIEMDSLTSEEDYPETRRVKKLKTTYVDYKPSGQLEEMKPTEQREPDVKPMTVTYRGDDITYGRIETTRKLPSTHRQEPPKAVERITVEEITFPRRTTVTSEEQTHQRQQGLKRKQETIEVKYERPTEKVTKVTRRSMEKTDIGRFVIDETVKPQKIARREPQVGRIEDMKVEEKPKQNGVYPLEPHIGSLLVKTAPTDEEHYEVRKERKVDHLYVKELDTTERQVKPQRDDTKTIRAQVTAEKVAVSKRDVTQVEETRKTKSRKQQDIGRIVIEETLEKKDEPKREISRKEIAPTKEPDVMIKKHKVMATKREVIPRDYFKEEVIKVRQSDVTPVVTRKDITRSIDRVDGRQQVIPDEISSKEVQEDTVSRSRITTEKVTVNISDIKQKEDIQQAKYAKQQDVGRIVIEELPEEKQQISKREVRREVVESIRDEAKVRRHDKKEARKHYVHEETAKVDKTHVQDFELAPEESRKVDERVTKYKERVESSRKCARKEDRIKVARLDVTTSEETSMESSSTEEIIYEVDGTRKGNKNQAKGKFSLKKSKGSIEHNKYHKEQSVGQFIIEEMKWRDESRSEKHGYHNKDSTTDVFFSRDEVKIGKLDVSDLENSQDAEHKGKNASISDELQRLNNVEPKHTQSEKLNSQKKQDPDNLTTIDQLNTIQTIMVNRNTIQPTRKTTNLCDVYIDRIIIEETPEEQTQSKTTPRRTQNSTSEKTTTSVTRYKINEDYRKDLEELTLRVGKLDVTKIEENSKRFQIKKEGRIYGKKMMSMKKLILTNDEVVTTTEEINQDTYSRHYIADQMLINNVIEEPVQDDASKHHEAYRMKQSPRAKDEKKRSIVPVTKEKLDEHDLEETISTEIVPDVERQEEAGSMSDKLEWINFQDSKYGESDNNHSKTKQSPDKKVIDQPSTIQTILVNMNAIHQTEQFKRIREIDIDRIIIDETPEKERQSKTALRRTENNKQGKTEASVTSYKINGNCGRNLEEKTLRVGKLDVTKIEEKSKGFQVKEKESRINKEKKDQILKTANGVRTTAKEIKPDKYHKDQEIGQILAQQLDTGHEDVSSIYNEKPKIIGTEISSTTGGVIKRDMVPIFTSDDKDVEIKVKIMNSELTEVESKLFEERYFIPIERPESPRKVSKVKNDLETRGFDSRYQDKQPQQKQVSENIDLRKKQTSNEVLVKKDKRVTKNFLEDEEFLNQCWRPLDVGKISSKATTKEMKGERSPRKASFRVYIVKQ